ncbi:PEP-CTERM sorting domain-containing protein [Leptolyngbya sp. FACHB-17]|uniref:PEP-CTERM sorting domain-containing protein n=1 Tax=unclassified Leptolyngbya TaxID=2650499 RepID=UPI001681519B|nr:PEP-CTERM sorting domain-containing protein [Leptolyngbya sp. FACHB-17]MBD2082022.1 PEP-CTERM sorting domain-containing protein [Leptolyngbya sp. FACHB-17]
MKSKGVLSASVLAVSLLALPSLPTNAANPNRPGGNPSGGGAPTAVSCSLGSVTAGGSIFSACQGAFSGNDDQSGSGALLNLLTTGVFNGITNWTFVGKSDSGTGAVTAPNAGISGNWSVQTGLTEPFVVSLKAGNFWSAYFFDNATSAAVFGGTWNTNGIATNTPELSHLTVYRANVTPPPERVPEPGTLAALGLAAVGAFGLKRKRTT